MLADGELLNVNFFGTENGIHGPIHLSTGLTTLTSGVIWYAH